jgi:hypothetical protein
MIFRWLAVPWMQRELDIYWRTVNLTKKRHDKRKLLPQGRPPQDIFSMPSVSDLLDFKVSEHHTIQTPIDDDDDTG